MTAIRTALNRLDRLLQEEHALLLSPARGRSEKLAAELDGALQALERATPQPSDRALASRLEATRKSAERNARLLGAALQGVQDAAALLTAARGARHVSYGADGRVETHAAPASRLQRKT